MAIEIVTPEIATAFLEASGKVQGHKNRNVKKDNVSKLKQEIVAGNWKTEVNLGIFISSDGFIMNGQHTCHAIAQAGQPVAVNVVRGASLDLMNSFDNGVARSVNDVFVMNNITNVTVKTAAAKVLYAYREKKPTALNKSPLTYAQILEFYNKNKGMDHFLYKSQSLNKEPGIKGAISLAFMYEADPKNKNSEVIEEWFKGLHKSVGLVENDPRTALASKIRAKKVRKLKRSPRDEVIEYIKCWNAWVTDAEIKILTVGSREGIPTILPASNKVMPTN